MDFGDWDSWRLLIAVLAGVVTVVVGVRTLLWRRLQLKSWSQTEKFQSDSHVLKLCEALSNPSQRLQMAAAALLIDRVTQRMENGKIDSEGKAIIQALLAATIDDPRDSSARSASSELCKYVADSVADALGALAPRGGKSQPAGASPLAGHYWQRVRLSGAYWAGIDARAIDFFGANFDRASLRNAKLSKSIFYEASLRGAVLSGADLREADLRFADLCGAKLDESDLEGAKLAGAKYDSRTRFPASFICSAAGMIDSEQGQASAMAS